jgi:hypothetical protein
MMAMAMRGAESGLEVRVGIQGDITGRGELDKRERTREVSGLGNCAIESSGN